MGLLVVGVWRLPLLHLLHLHGGESGQLLARPVRLAERWERRQARPRGGRVRVRMRVRIRVRVRVRVRVRERAKARVRARMRVNTSQLCERPRRSSTGVARSRSLSGWLVMGSPLLFEAAERQCLEVRASRRRWHAAVHLT